MSAVLHENFHDSQQLGEYPAGFGDRKAAELTGAVTRKKRMEVIF